MVNMWVLNKLLETERAMNKSKAERRPIALLWRIHNHNSVRVWRDDWLSGQYEIMSIAQFNDLRRMCDRFAIMMTPVDEPNEKAS